MQSLLSVFNLSAHQIEDFALYLPFLAGQLIYIIKRAGFSVRAGRAKSRRDYLYMNWDILLFRSALEFVFVYFPVRHFTPAQLLSLVHLDFSNVSFLTTVVGSPVSIFAAGMASDGLFDWLVDWASRSPKIPNVVKNWLSENVQQNPLVKQ